MTVELHPDGTARGTIPAGPDVLVGGGWPRAGIVGVLVDTVAGAVAVMSARPERVATADLTLQLVRPVGPAGPAGPAEGAEGAGLTVEAEVTRRGRTTVVIEAKVLEDRDGPPVGWATLTFALLPARSHQLDKGGQLHLDGVVKTEFGAGQPRRSVLERIGFAAGPLVGNDRGGALPTGVGGARPTPVGGARPTGGGELRDVVQVEAADYVRNTFGAIQGGIVTLIVDEAARRSAPGAVVVDLHLAFLAPCKEGPIVGSATALQFPGASPGSALVELRDSGAGDRVTTIADVGLIREPAGARR